MKECSIVAKKKKKAAAACSVDWLVNAAQRVGVIPRTHAGDVWRYLTKTEGCVTSQTSTGGAVSVPVLCLSGVVLRNCAKLSRLKPTRSLMHVELSLNLLQLYWWPIRIQGEWQQTGQYCALGKEVNYLRLLNKDICAILKLSKKYIPLYCKKYTEGFWILTQTLISSNFLNWNTVKPLK